MREVVEDWPNGETGRAVVDGAGTKLRTSCAHESCWSLIGPWDQLTREAPRPIAQWQQRAGVALVDSIVPCIERHAGPSPIRDLSKLPEAIEGPPDSTMMDG